MALTLEQRTGNLETVVRGLQRREENRTNETADVMAGLGKLASEVATLSASVKNLGGQLSTRIDGVQKSVEALAKGVNVDLRKELDSMRPRLDSTQHEVEEVITEVGDKARKLGELATVVNKLVQEKRETKRLKRKLWLAVLLGFAGTIGAGIGVGALKSCGVSGPAQVEVHP